jgi:hypothetical protein
MSILLSPIKFTVSDPSRSNSSCSLLHLLATPFNLLVPLILTGIAGAPSSSTPGRRRAVVSTRAWTVYLCHLSFSPCHHSSVPV